MEKILFIVNPIAGTKDKKQILEKTLSKIDTSRYCFDTVASQYPRHAEEIARNCDADIVVAVGGDGTINEVACGAVASGKTLGIIPCGSGNGLALHLGISHNNIAGIINNGKTSMMDYGLIDGRTFFSISGVGLDAIVSHRFAQSGKRGLKSYISEAVKTWKEFKPETYRIECDGELWTGKAAIISVGNSNQWGNNARITAGASLSDGLLDISIVLPFKTLEIPDLAIKLMTGHIHESKESVYMQGREITIYREHEGPAHFDGDPFHAPRTVAFSIVPKGIRILVP